MGTGGTWARLRGAPDRLATALQRVGRDDEADPLQAARDEFHRFGAVRDEAAATPWDCRGAEAIPTIAHKTFMFTDIVASPASPRPWATKLDSFAGTMTPARVFVDSGGEVVNPPATGSSWRSTRPFGDHLR